MATTPIPSQTLLSLMVILRGTRSPIFSAKRRNALFKVIHS